LVITGSGTNVQNFYNNLISFKPDVIVEPPIGDELLDLIITNQEILNELPLDDEILLDNLTLPDPDVVFNPPVIIDPDPIVTEEAPLIIDIPPVGTPEVPPPTPIYGLTASGLSCVESQQLTHFATYTSNDGATLVSVSPVAGAVSISVGGISNNVVSLNVICPASSGSYSATLNGLDSLGRSVSVTFAVTVGIPPITLTVSDVTCMETDFVDVIATLSGATISYLDSITIIDTGIAYLDGVEDVSGSTLTQSIYCDYQGVTDITISVFASDGNVYTDTAQITVNPFVVTLTVNDTFCVEGSTGTVTATLNGTNIGGGGITIFTINGANATELGPRTFVGDTASIPINCITQGTVTVDITVEDPDFQPFSASGTIFVSPPPPVGTLSANNSSCVEGSSTSITVGYTPPMGFPDRMIGAVVSIVSDNPTGADDVGHTFGVPAYSFDVAVNCFVAGTANITIYITDTNGDPYNATATITIDPPPAPPYFSGGTDFACIDGEQVVMNFEYIENEPGSPTLSGASVNTSGSVSVQPANITLINGNMWVSVIIDCDFPGDGFVDVYATTTSGLYPTVDVTGITFTVATSVGTPFIQPPANIVCTIGQQIFVSYLYNANGGENLGAFSFYEIDNTTFATISNVNPSGNYLDLTIDCVSAGSTVLAVEAYTSPSLATINAPFVQITVNP
jgi:hypothetical protein